MSSPTDAEISTDTPASGTALAAVVYTPIKVDLVAIKRVGAAEYYIGMVDVCFDRFVDAVRQRHVR